MKRVFGKTGEKFAHINSVIKISAKISTIQKHIRIFQRKFRQVQSIDETVGEKIDEFKITIMTSVKNSMRPKQQREPQRKIRRNKLGDEDVVVFFDGKYYFYINNNNEVRYAFD